MSWPKRGAEIGAPGRNRKAPADLIRPEHSLNGPALYAEPERLPFCPMLAHLRAINAPLFEDMPLRRAHLALRARRAPPRPTSSHPVRSP